MRPIESECVGFLLAGLIAVPLLPWVQPEGTGRIRSTIRGRGRKSPDQPVVRRRVLSNGQAKALEAEAGKSTRALN